MRGNINPFTSSEFALLGFLYEKPTHGYDLHKLITDPDGIGLIWNVKMSNLYAYLDKLDKKGYIHGTMQPGDAHPTRMEYQITNEGKTAFETWLDSIVQHPRDFRQEFMLRYFFLLKYHRGSMKSIMADSAMIPYGLFFITSLQEQCTEQTISRLIKKPMNYFSKN